ncbi:MAG: DoxX family protein [Candidatus Pacebacteria bacterium]|nr:DoxX family protein [Candidatus Paceibacterota bacterium]
MKHIIKKYWAHIIIAIILLQTLFYKFSAHPESVTLFTELQLFGLPEAYGRIGVGVAELLVSIGLFIKPSERESLFGVMALMAGALYFHITKLGFAGNNLPLAISAIVALVLAVYIYAKKYTTKKTR